MLALLLKPGSSRFARSLEGRIRSKLNLNILYGILLWLDVSREGLRCILILVRHDYEAAANGRSAVSSPTICFAHLAPVQKDYLYW